MMNLFSDDMRRNPFPIYDQLRSGSPVFQMPGTDIWMVFDYDGVKRTLTDHDAFSSRTAPGGGKPLDWLIFFDPPRHTKLRALLSKAFTPRAINSLEPRIRTLSRELLDQTIERGAMDLTADFSSPLPLLVIAEMIGIPPEDQPRFKRWCDMILTLADTVSGGGEEAARAEEVYREAKGEMRTYLEGLIEARRSAPRDDLLTRLVEAEVDGERLTGNEILGFFQLLLVAGSETTTNLISNTILSFIEFPDQLEKLRAAPHLLTQTIDEVLRFRSPVQTTFRESKRDIELSGQVIPAGRLVLAVIGSANRDPLQFRDPERFDITRDPNPHIAFGHGIHFCLGAPLARLEARVALTELLERIRRVELVSDTWEPRQAFHVHGPNRLPIRFEAGARTVALA